VPATAVVGLQSRFALCFLWDYYVQLDVPLGSGVFGFFLLVLNEVLVCMSVSAIGGILLCMMVLARMPLL